MLHLLWIFWTQPTWFHNSIKYNRCSLFQEYNTIVCFTLKLQSSNLNVNCKHWHSILKIVCIKNIFKTWKQYNRKRKEVRIYFFTFSFSVIKLKAIKINKKVILMWTDSLRWTDQRLPCCYQKNLWNIPSSAISNLLCKCVYFLCKRNVRLHSSYL